MNTNEKLFEFIKSSPSCFHAIDNISKKLEAEGAVRLCESSRWNISRGKTYFTARNGSSMIAFRIPEEIDGGFMIAAAHSDSPTFKIKDKPELEGGNYVRINTERY
ncbi:MAG: M18 family aminopeptidase, partial [Candidatus Flemingiibacterium sp.]